VVWPLKKIDRARARKNALRLVASFECAKGIFVLCIGVVAVLLVHRDAWEVAQSVLAALHISTDRRSAHLFLHFADRLTDARLWMAAWLAFAYSALRFIEAYGLWKQRTWAEWVAFLSGTLGLPLEIRSMMRGVTFMRVAIFVGNLAIIFYMWFLIQEGRRQRFASFSAESREQQGK
jgi:uncharacterized membrane protein (DUF2068 family)